MRNFFTMLLAILVLGICSVVINTAQADDASDRQELLRLEKVWNDAHLEANADVLESLWSDGLVVTVPKMGLMTKADSMAFVRSGRMKFQKYETSDVVVRLYGDAAVVTGRLLRARTINGNNMLDDWRFTKVYIRHIGKWQVVSWQASESPTQ